MAHSLTQQPSASLPFPSGARTNPLGFSFGISAFSPHASPSIQPSPSSSAFPFPKAAQPSPIGFGFSHAPSTSTPLVKHPLQQQQQHYTGSPAKKKRSRQSSLSSTSSSPMMAGATLPSPRAQSGKSLDVGGLALDDGERRRVVKRNMKRVRQEGDGSMTGKSDDDVDLGVLLATLPPTSHLPILLHLLKQDPSLEAAVLSQIPQPDLSECLAALDRSMSKCRKALGVNVKVDVEPQRRWSRASPEVEALVRMASTYLSFFASSSKTSDPHTTHQLLQTITTDILFLLAYVPPNTSTETSPIKQLLDLAKSLPDKWTTWINDLSREINQNGSMFPHSMATQWADGLDALSTAPITHHGAGSWSAFGTHEPAPLDNHLVSSFRQAIEPLRQRFYVELGWVIGRSIMVG